MLRGSVGIMAVGGDLFFWYGCSYLSSGMKYNDGLSRGDGRTARFLLISCFRRSTFHHEHIRSCPRKKD